VLRAGPQRVLLTRRRKRIAVAGLSIDQLVAWGVLYYAYTVLSAPIAADLGVSRLSVAAAFSLCLLVAGWAGRAVGPVLDARGARGVLRLGAIVAPLSFAGLALVGGVASLVVGFALLGLAHALALYEPAFRAIVDGWADPRARSRALLVVTLVGGLASTVFLPVTGWLLAHLGWRQAVLVLAAVLALVLVPTRWLLPLPRRRHDRAPATSGDAPRSATLLAAGLAVHALASTGVSVYLLWLLVERGESLAAAAGLAGAAGAAQLPGRLVSGPLRAVVGGAAFLPLVLAVQAIALVAVVSTGGAVAVLAIVVFGATGGMMTLERATVLLERYGRASFGAHQGRLAAATSTARAASPFVVEAGHQVFSYGAVFTALAALLALAAWTCRSAARRHALELA
jgi:MFS family permease